jgi:hypothetical protein
VVSPVCGSYFNVPKMQRAIVATSASRGQRAMAKVSGTSTRCRSVSANSCSVFITHPPASLGDLAEHSLHHALELDFNEFGKDFFAQDEPQLGIEFGRADIAGFVGLVLGCGAVQVPGSELADFAPGSALPLAKNARVHPPCSPLNKSRVLNFWLRTKSVDIKLSFPLLAIQAAPGSFFWAA